MAEPATSISDLDPIPQNDPTITDVAKEVEELDREAADSTEVLKEVAGYMKAPGVQKVVDDLIYEKMGYLQGEPIVCLHATKGTEAITPYAVKKFGPLHSAIASFANLADSDVVSAGDEFFALIVPLRMWENIDAKTKEALVYDALQRFEVGDRRRVKKPDFQGMFNTVAEYGFWQEPLKKFADVARPHIAQLQLLES